MVARVAVVEVVEAAVVAAAVGAVKAPVQTAREIITTLPEARTLALGRRTITQTRMGRTITRTTTAPATTTARVEMGLTLRPVARNSTLELFRVQDRVS